MISGSTVMPSFFTLQAAVNRAELHAADFRERNAEAASAMAEHGVELDPASDLRAYLPGQTSGPHVLCGAFAQMSVSTDTVKAAAMASASQLSSLLPWI
jgi:hypothetical protein